MDIVLPSLPPLPEIRFGPIRKRIFAYNSREYGSKAPEFDQSTEVLEHIGDQVLDLIQDLSPHLGDYPASRMRDHIKRKIVIAEICVSYGLHKRVNLPKRQANSLRALQSMQASVFKAYVGGVYRDRGLEVVTDWLISVFQSHVGAANQNLHDDRPLLPVPEAVDEGSTPLHLTSESRDVDISRFFLEYDEDANAQGMEGWTPLHHASQVGNLKFTQFLLFEHDTDPEVRDQDKLTPLHVASGCGHVDIARVLLEKGADANVQDVSSWTPLHLASQEGHQEVVQLLLDHGGKVNAQDEDKQTPLSLASSNGSRKVVQLLLENDADPNILDWLKRTPLHRASENGHLDVLLLLLDRDTDVNAKDVHSWTPLHMASKTGHLAVTQKLLDCGAEVEAQDDLGWTPLHMASQEGHLGVVVELLLNRRAHVDTKEANWETALHLAVYYGHLQVTQLLLDCGANVLALNKDGKSPFDLASKRNDEIAELLLAKLPS